MTSALETLVRDRLKDQDVVRRAEAEKAIAEALGIAFTSLGAYILAVEGLSKKNKARLFLALTKGRRGDTHVSAAFPKNGHSKEGETRGKFSGRMRRKLPNSRRPWQRYPQPKR